MVFLRESTGESNGIGWCTRGSEITPENKTIFPPSFAFIFFWEIQANCEVLTWWPSKIVPFCSVQSMQL